MNKERLKECQSIERELRQLEGRLEELEAAIYSVGAKLGDGLPKASGKKDFADILAKLIDLKEIYVSKWDELIDKRNEIEKAIENLTATERILIRARYVEGLGWIDICNLLGYEWAQTHRIHSSALQRLSRADEKLDGKIKKLKR